MGDYPGGKSHRLDVDGLRALAVTGVLAYHAAPDLVPGGFVGVDVFFVISGFLISGIILSDLQSSSFSFAAFYRRRARRILPALLVVLSTVWLVGLFALWPNRFAELGAHVMAASVFASNFLLGQEAGYFDSAAQFKPLLHLWSLAIEEQFYLLWPLTLFAAWKWRLNIPALLFLVIIVSFWLGAHSLASHSIWAFYGPQNRMWELALGSLLASTRHEFIPAEWRNVAAAVGAALVIGAMFAFDGSVPYPGWRALAPTVGTALLIAAGPKAWINRRALSLHPVVTLGFISYPLYLWHWPILSFTRGAFGALPISVAVTDVTASLALAWATWRFIETPIRSGRFRPSRHVVPALTALLCAAAILGVSARWSDGFAFRIQATLQDLANYHFDQYRAYRGAVAGGCFLEPDEDERAFGRDCAPESRPLLLLWGDSHAAHLYPGLKGDPRFAIAQYTASACPPILDVDVDSNPLCRRINTFVANKVPALRPDVVLLAASWWGYPNLDLARLKRSVDVLQRGGVRTIILLGPVPVWTPTLPEALLRAYAEGDGLPIRMSVGVTRRTALDDRLRQMAADWHISFLSPQSALCDANGCATLVGRDPVQWDSAHLTSAGSRFLFSRMPIPQ